MKEYLIETSKILNEIDNNPLKSLQFFTTTLSSTTITNKPPDNCRLTLIIDILHNLICNYTQIEDSVDISKCINEILDNINSKYQQHQHFCWKSHESHFHKAFDEYVNCPVTCIYELSEFLDKLAKECYGQ